MTPAVTSAIARRNALTREALADLAAGTHTREEIATRLGYKSVASVSALVRRFEKSAGVSLGRTETRGRKPKPLAAA